MKTAFRVDASIHIGTGHVIRCLTLANALREQGAAVLFVCREHEGHLCDLLERDGHAVRRLPVPRVGIQTRDAADHAWWLGASWQEDAEQTRAAIDSLGAKPDWLIVDHYAVDHQWDAALRKSVGRIMVIDDLADRVHDCDLLLDQNLVAHMHSRYADKVPPACGMLMGPQYAMLQPIYAELRDSLSPRKGPIRRLFIFFGGADTENVTGRALAAFLHLNRQDIEVDVVTVGNSTHAQSIRQQVTGRANIHLHTNLPTLAPLMAISDLAIGAGGATSWERLCLGLPSLVIVIAENQKPIAEELSHRGLIRFLGDSDKVSTAIIAEALDDLIQKGADSEWSRRCLREVDGMGVRRVCAALTVDATTQLHIRHAVADDENLLLTWANDPITRRNGFHPDTISAVTHKKWFLDRLQNKDKYRLYMIETDAGVAIGQVRFERQEEGWQVNYAVAPLFRARGLGRPVLEKALLQLHRETDGGAVFGLVKENNLSSQKIFEALGFRMLPNQLSGTIVYRRDMNGAPCSKSREDHADSTL